MSGFLKGESDKQTSTLDTLKEEYNDLPGYAYDAILRSKQSQLDAASKSNTGPDDILSFDNNTPENVTDAEGMGLLNPDVAYESGTTYTMTEAQAISDGSDEIYDATTENTDSAKQAIIDSKEETEKAVQENFNDPFQLRIRSGKVNAGKSVEYVVDGMIQAMDDKNGSYAAAAVRLAKAGNKAFEKENKISSPSKVYYQNGEYIVQGLINGIEHNIQHVESTAGDLSDAILTSFGDPIGYVSKFMTGEIEYDPSIRPVFDNSGVSKGAASINSMLSKQTISVSGFSGKLAADIGTLDKSNSDVVSELQALREDMLMMQDAMENMQIVMDTGALVGSTVGAYDKALGQQQIYSKRGTI